MNAERKFLFACLIFALVIYAIHAFGLFDLLTDLPHLQTLILPSPDQKRLPLGLRIRLMTAPERIVRL